MNRATLEKKAVHASEGRVPSCKVLRTERAQGGLTTSLTPLRRGGSDNDATQVQSENSVLNTEGVGRAEGEEAETVSVTLPLRL